MAIKTSPDVGLRFGVPRGSVLGPKNYSMYTERAGEIIKRYNIKYHCYAYDTQVYMSLRSCDKCKDDVSSSIEAYIADISTCMNSNMLKLNKDNTAFISFSSKQYEKKIENLRIKVVSSYINYSMSVSNLGLILNNTVGMEKQMNYICKSCYYQIRNIGLIRKYINDKTCKT